MVIEELHLVDDEENYVDVWIYMKPFYKLLNMLML